MANAPDWLPIARWLPRYRRADLLGDLGASIVVAVLLIPQSMAYAMLAGLPPVTGLYASTLPLLAYALFGHGMTQSVGPMALTSLMTASALAPIIATGQDPLAAATVLALLCGAMLIAFGLLRLGRITRLLSLPVVSGFTSGTAILIGLGQLGPLLGIRITGEQLPEQLAHWLQAAMQLQPAPLGFGLVALGLFWLVGEALPRLLQQRALFSRLLPIVVLVLLTRYAHTHPQLAKVGPLPSAELTLSWPTATLDGIAELWLPALLIGLVGYLQSLTIAQTLAQQRGETVDPDQELLALGAANLAAGSVGGLPVSGGFSRTAVNAGAGARTPMAGVFTAGWIVLAAATLGDLLALLPKAALAATIVLAAFKLIDLHQLRASWRYDRRDGAALIATLAVTLLFGAMPGIASGVLLSLALYIHRTSQPQIVVLGRLPGTEHFRNVERFDTETWPQLTLLRLDENLYFGNARAVEDGVLARLDADTRDVVLVLSGVASIDYSAAGMLDKLDTTLAARGIALHLAELKVPLQQRLAANQLLGALRDRSFLNAHQAVIALLSAEPSTKNPA
ncbi:SulP family inorganic anion transporter [Chitinolyticbacter meiyuanensis]|uniref:SulP family inorganic anion transporter n=1 Tax=Chitinolyticbacter meiyuanensis TaxID=682798 RepID=UPI00165280EB|nr:sulfate permease [Chitinolyticbacter meiyuanensis]